MSYWLWITLPAAMVLLLLMLYIDFSLYVEVREDEAFQGWSVRVKSIFYSYKKEYNYTDPHFRLLESIILAGIESAKDGQPGSNELKDKKSYPGYLSQLFSRFQMNRSESKIYASILRFSVVESLKWTTVVGCRDAMYTAVGTGLCWAISGAVIGFLSSKASFRRIRLEVKPDFSRSAFLSTIDCIFKLRTAHIICIAIYATVIKVVYKWSYSKKNRAIVPLKV